MPMNRSADEIIEAMAACVLNGGAYAFLLGDNEMARLVEQWREMKSASLSAELAYEKGKCAGIELARAALNDREMESA